LAARQAARQAARLPLLGMRSARSAISCVHIEFVERELRQVVVSARPRHDLHQFNRGCEKVDQLLR
jgi:hypothetical protein